MAKIPKTVEKIINLSDNADGAILKMNLSKFLETRALIQASSGGGKSWLLRLIAEQTMHAAVPVWLIDPEGEYVSLREKFDVVVFGEDGDLPIDENTLARVLPELLRLGVSAVFDLSELRFDEQQSAVVSIAGEMMKLKRPDWKPFLLAVDETQRLAPQGQTTPAMAALADVASRGRKRGFGLAIATQRLSALDKNITTQLLNRFIGLCLEDVEIKRAAEYIGKDNSKELVLLEAGDFFALGSALVDVKGSFRFHAGQVETTHPDSTVRHAPAAVPQASGEFAKIIVELREKLIADEKADESIEPQKNEADNPRRENALDEKERLLNQYEIQLAERAVQLHQQQQQIENLKQEIFDQLTNAAQLVAGNFDFLQEKFRQVFDGAEFISDASGNNHHLTAPKAHPPGCICVTCEDKRNQPVVQASPVALATPKPTNKGTKTADFLKPKQQAILNTLATFAALGVAEVDKTNVAVFSRVSPKSSDYSGNLTFLRNAENKHHHLPPLIEYVVGNKVRLTVEGAKYARPSVEINSLNDLHNAWCNYLPAKQAAMIRYLVTFGANNPIGRDKLAHQTNQSINSSAWTANLSALRKFGILEYSNTGGKPSVYLTELLFPAVMRSEV